MYTTSLSLFLDLVQNATKSTLYFRESLTPGLDSIRSPPRLEP